DGRLRNPKFRASAPEEVVSEAEARAQVLREEIDRLEQALGQLAEAG
ncbi:MAG: hypothetical protein EA407_13915, partial [Rhodobacteraceae bacterium]